MKKNILAGILGVMMTVSLFGSFNVKAASAVDSIPSGTAVIGDKAISLAYANDSNHTDEINDLIVNNSNGGHVYVKDFSDEWIDNNSGKAVDSSVVTAKTYTDASGKTTDLSGTSTDPSTDAFQITGIE